MVYHGLCLHFKSNKLTYIICVIEYICSSRSLVDIGNVFSLFEKLYLDIAK